MKIVFNSIKYKNFRSVGNTPVELRLDSHKTTLVCGTNGDGKSTSIHAMCFALFGKGFGNINKPALINSINQKHTEVTIIFTIGTKVYKVIRGMKPNKFEIYENDILINQDPHVKDYQKVLENQILKMNYRSFTQVVVVGSGEYVPFMVMSAKDRREFVEDLLDIRVFSTMNTLLKDEMKLTKDDLKDIDAEIKSTRDKVNLQESFVKKLKKERGESIDKLLASIRTCESTNNRLLGDTEKIQAEILKLDSEIILFAHIQNTIRDTKNDQRKLAQERNEKLERKEFYQGVDVCPMCKQNINDSHRHPIISALEDELVFYEKELQNSVIVLDNLNSQLTEYEELLDSKFGKQNNMAEVSNAIHGNQVLIQKAREQISDYDNTSSIDIEKNKLKDFAKRFIVLDKKRKELIEKTQYQELTLNMLSDVGIKSKIIKQYIPTFNKRINKYLSELDFFCNFHLNENFEETIKSRHRDNFTYANFSDGQKRRIDAALLLTWRDIAKAKNSVSTNVLILDEFDSALDGSGSEMLQQMLKVCAAENVFLISHKDIMADKVDSVIKFIRKNNFTELVLE